MKKGINISSYYIFLVMFLLLPSATFAYELPDTGQTTSYTDTFGEDSDYTINPQSYTLNSDGTTTDNVTGLIWQSSDDDQTYNWYEASGTPHETYNPGGTIDVCGNLGLAGYDDWRLPTEIELLGIVNHDLYDPAIDQTYFPGTNSSNFGSADGYYWSSTSAVHFYAGYQGGDVKSNYYTVRCVRGEQTNHSFIDNGDGTETDVLTELTWQQEDDILTGNCDRTLFKTWEEAIQYCEDLELPVGQSDWRLPNIKELFTKKEYLRCNFWSSTSYALSPGAAWLLLGNTLDTFSKSGEIRPPYIGALCVRGGQPDSSFSLTINEPTGGTVYGPGICCGTACEGADADCLEVYSYGEEITLSVEPDNGWKFDYWDDGIATDTNESLNIFVVGEKTITANFTYVSPGEIVDIYSTPFGSFSINYDADFTSGGGYHWVYSDYSIYKIDGSNIVLFNTPSITLAGITWKDNSLWGITRDGFLHEFNMSSGEILQTLSTGLSETGGLEWDGNNFITVSDYRGWNQDHPVERPHGDLQYLLDRSRTVDSGQAHKRDRRRIHAG